MTPPLYLRPLGLESRLRLGRLNRSGPLWDLAGGPLAFSDFEILQRAEPPESKAASTEEIEAVLGRIAAPRSSFAGLDLTQPRVMGIVNVTPDSFSDGGDRFDPAQAIEDGLAMHDAGADIVDIGGESTRPGADPVPLQEELRRVLPVVQGLAEAGVTVSIDSRHAAVMRAALAAGARVVNDVTALTGDPDSLGLVAETGAPVILMHMRGEPRNMQAEPRYDDVVLDVYDYLAGAIARCQSAGISPDRIAIDPGIGFGKTVAHNLQLLDGLALFHGLGCPVLLGASRKSFIGKLSRGEPAKERLPGSLAVLLAAVQRGIQILRVHDVAETVQALALWRSVNEPMAG